MYIDKSVNTPNLFFIPLTVTWYRASLASTTDISHWWFSSSMTQQYYREHCHLYIQVMLLDTQWISSNENMLEVTAFLKKWISKYNLWNLTYNLSQSYNIRYSIWWYGEVGYTDMTVSVATDLLIKPATCTGKYQTLSLSLITQLF